MKNIDDKIQTLIKRDALFVVNHSGGKDSQAMMIKIRNLVPHHQIMIVHAHLPGVEWPGTQEHIEDTCAGHEIRTTQAVKTFFEMARHRGMWPSPKYRQCTSDLKRGPIEKTIRHELKARNLHLVVNCMGLRAEESSARSKAQVFKLNERNSKAGREWYDWLPIHDMLIGEVFSNIAQAGEKPHWAYAAGMSRLSCCFCIMSSQADLETAARLNPDLFAKYVELEREIDHSFMMPKKNQAPRYLEEIAGIQIQSVA